MHQCDADAADLRAEIMRSSQHDKTDGGADADQTKRHGCQKRRQQKSNDDLRADDDDDRRELHQMVGGRADPRNVAADQVRDACMLQARHHRPGRRGEPAGEAGADGFDEASLDLRQLDVAAGDDNRPHDHQDGK